MVQTEPATARAALQLRVPGTNPSSPTLTTCQSASSSRCAPVFQSPTNKNGSCNRDSAACSTTSQKRVFYHVCGMPLAGPRSHDVEYANPKAVCRQIDVRASGRDLREVPDRASYGPSACARRPRFHSGFRPDASSRRVRIPSPSSRRTGPGAEFSHGNHIGVVGGDFNDVGQAGATAMLNVPGKEFHGSP